MILDRFLVCFSRQISKSLGEVFSKPDPSNSPPMPMKNEVGHFWIQETIIRFSFKKEVENQVSFFIRFLMIFGWFWGRFWECFGYRNQFKNILKLSIVFKAVF